VFWLIACSAPVALPEPTWPDSGCRSTHAPALDAVRVSSGERTLSAPDGTVLAAALAAPLAQGCWPGLLLVPPGFDPGLQDTDQDTMAELAAAGVVVLAFDPRGRGASAGGEDHGGPTQQDDVASLLAWLAALDEVDPDRVYLRTRSLGIALAAGAVDRHPVLAPAGLLDIEGPGTLPDDLVHASAHTQERWDEVAGDEDWWLDRSPSEHLGAFRGAYRRVQAREDHALGAYRGHALTLLNVAEGASSRADLNGVALAEHRAVEEPPEWSPDDVEALSLGGTVQRDDARALELLVEMMR